MTLGANIHIEEFMKNAYETIDAKAGERIFKKTDPYFRFLLNLTRNLNSHMNNTNAILKAVKKYLKSAGKDIEKEEKQFWSAEN